MGIQFKFTADTWKHNNTRLTNQIFKLLPMFENGEDWKLQRETVILELHGYNRMFSNTPGFMVLIAKLYALSDVIQHVERAELDQDQQEVESRLAFRKLVFEAIAELQKIQVIDYGA